MIALPECFVRRTLLNANLKFPDSGTPSKTLRYVATSPPPPCCRHLALLRCVAHRSAAGPAVVSEGSGAAGAKRPHDRGLDGRRAVCGRRAGHREISEVVREVH